MTFPFKSFFQCVSILLILGACTQIPQAGYKDANLVPEDVHTPPILFSNLRVDIPAGHDFGRVSDFGVLEANWFSVPANRRVLQEGMSREELSRVFNDVLEGQGYDVVRYLDLTFEDEIENEYLRTEYRVGGKIIDAKMDVDYNDADGVGPIILNRPGERGELYLKIKWSVYDALRRNTVYSIVTEGTGEQKRSNPDGLVLMVNAAFEVAAHNLAADQGFHDLMVKGIKPEGWKPKKKQDDRPLKYEGNEEVELNALPLSREPFPKDIKPAQKNAVLVQAGAGHGSGFFITKEGHILTNRHVVGNAQRVRIVTHGYKKKMVAQVLRVDAGRDVALLKVEEMPDDLKIQLMPIRLDWPKVSEEIYAFGAPQSVRLHSTLSKGIVSAHRKGYRVLGTRENFIQGDVSIHGGNSGGPLYDAYGNIVGISVIALHVDESRQTSDLNLFIPIQEGLDRLGISY